MAEGLTLSAIPEKFHVVPPGAVAMIAEPMAFVAAEAVMGDLPESPHAYVLETGHEVRFFGWPCTCGGVRCGPDREVWEGTRVLVLPPLTDLHELTPVDLP